MKKITIFILILPFSLASDNRRLIEYNKCEIVEEAIEGVAAGPMDARYLYIPLLPYIRTIPNICFEVLGNLQRTSGYKFMTAPEDRHSFACRLAASRSRAEVGMLFGISRRKTEDFFQHCVVKDEDLGDLQIMTLVTEMYGLLFEWADFTGYPVMPFRRVYERTTLLVYERVAAILEKTGMYELTSSIPFPIRVSPATALLNIKTAKSYSELETGTAMAKGGLKNFAREMLGSRNYITNAPRGLSNAFVLHKALRMIGFNKLK